ncbi:hypothetical protein SanaruYs_13580 [Chryseotalea sanaruensis]|uniref:Uncharacterized protein n=1 Tax=Chryseotalea sanaruensis TaxID=2482724 RepID=A0A401U8B9_9BACT|nr:DUF2268 domain-containing putative Zn-dependent protease [Chryseotalea sanaruensis]GCC51138.1 hypothetical protein SanaruYs_13580 [Chryseotalea sanaruensis]
MIRTSIVISFLLVVHQLYGQQLFSTNPDSAVLHTEDITLFWNLFDKNPSLNAGILESEYLQKGSEGLKAFIPNRIESGKHLNKIIKHNREYYKSIHESSLSIISKKELILTHFKKFQQLYPGAVFPDVYFVIGAKNSGGTAFKNGLIVGAEVFGEIENKIAPRVDIDLIDDVVIHELVHFQQNYVLNRSLLAQSIREGSADFLCELVTGTHSNQIIYEYGNAHEAELWKEFKERMFENSWSGWLYYQRDKSRPNDLGYWMGYKITKAYYDKAENKSKAIVDILTIQDFKKFLEDSAYVGSR